MMKNNLEYLFSILRENVGWEFNEDDSFFIYSKIEEIFRTKAVESYEEMISKLEDGNKAFFWSIVESFSINSGSFLGDTESYSDLSDVFLPYLIENKANKNINILSLGSGNGQECYSMAILLRKLLGDDFDNWKVKLSGFDVSSDAIIKSQKGYYNHFEIQKGLNAKDIVENFDFRGDFWQAKSFLTNMTNFQRVNIFKDNLDIISEYDLILFRNVINIFSDENKLKIISKIAKNQKKMSFLCLETTDSNLGMSEYYKRIKDTKTIYVRI